MPTLGLSPVQIHKPNTLCQSILRHSMQQALSETLKMQQQLPSSFKTAQFNYHRFCSLFCCRLWRPTLPFHQLWHSFDPLESEFSSLNWQKSNPTKQNKTNQEKVNSFHHFSELMDQTHPRDDRRETNGVCAQERACPFHQQQVRGLTQLPHETSPAGEEKACWRGQIH